MTRRRTHGYPPMHPTDGRARAAQPARAGVGGTRR
ncbi:hypothetical protein DO70_5339 [Burkholderia pseudomallei]|nr:hypothetical protein DO70_5339 [Burkholderia pseudomallei]